MVSYMSDAEYYVGLIKRPVDPHKWFLLMSGYNVNGYGGLKGRAFNELMKLCFSRAELFSFTSMQNPKYQRHPVLEELEDLRIGTIQTDRWFGYYGVEPEIYVSIFRAEKAACDVICSYFCDIYLRNKDRVDIALEAMDLLPEDYYRLEDLTFYIDGRFSLGLCRTRERRQCARRTRNLSGRRLNWDIGATTLRITCMRSISTTCG